MPKKKKTNPLLFGKTKSGQKLTRQQEAFCKAYVYMKGDLIESYDSAYKLDHKNTEWRVSASAGGWRLLQKPKIIERIGEILNELGLKDEIVDAELLDNILQKGDRGAKNRAIDMYNKLKNRYEQNNTLTIKSKELANIGEALRALAHAGPRNNSGGEGDGEEDSRDSVQG